MAGSIANLRGLLRYYSEHELNLDLQLVVVAVLFCLANDLLQTTH